MFRYWQSWLLYCVCCESLAAAIFIYWNDNCVQHFNFNCWDTGLIVIEENISTTINVTKNNKITMKSCGCADNLDFVSMNNLHFRTY